MELRAIFLDFGGTLVEPLRDGYPVFADVLGSNGIPLEAEVYRRAESELSRSWGPVSHRYLGAGPGFWDEYHVQLLDRLGISRRRAELTKGLHDAFTSPRWHRPYPEVDEVLEELLRWGLTLHVVSNNTELLSETIGRLGWSRRFATITYSQEVGAEKPDPRVFRRALERAGCSPTEVLHVGDSWEADVLGARAAGIPALWLDRGGLGPERDSPRVRDLRGILIHLGHSPARAQANERE